MLHPPDHVGDVGVRIRILEGDDRQALIDQGRLLVELLELRLDGFLQAVELLLKRLILRRGLDGLLGGLLLGLLLPEKRRIPPDKVSLVILPRPQAKELVVQRPAERGDQKERADEKKPGK